MFMTLTLEKTTGEGRRPQGQGLAGINVIKLIFFILQEHKLWPLPGNPYEGRRGRLALTSLYQLLLIIQTIFTFFTKTSNVNEEVNRTEPSPSVSFPWSTY
jgi:hypothetical protein